MVEVINLCDSDEELDVVLVSPDTSDKEEEQVAHAAAPARGVKRALEAKLEVLEVSEDEVSDGAATQAPRLRTPSWHPPPTTAKELPLLQSPPPANITVLVNAPAATTPRLPLVAAKTLQLQRATPPTAEPSQPVAAQLQLALAHPGEPWGTQRQREAEWLRPTEAARRWPPAYSSPSALPHSESEEDAEPEEPEAAPYEEEFCEEPPLSDAEVEEQPSPQRSLPPVEPVGLNKRNCGSKVRKLRPVRRPGEKVGAALPLPPPPLPLPLRRLLLAAMSDAGLSCDPHASLGGGNGDGATGSTPLLRLLRLRETGAFAGTAPSSDDVIPRVTVSAMSPGGSFAAAPARAPPQPGRPAALRASFCDHARGWRHHHGAFPGAACSLTHRAAFAGTHGGWSQRSFAYGLEHNPVMDLRWARASGDAPVFAMSMLDSGLLKVFALPPGEPHTCVTLCGGGRGNVTDFCFALGGTRLVAANNTDSVLRVHALADGCWKLDESSAAWAAGGATATPRLAVNPRQERDRLVASLHSDSSLLLWDVSLGSLGRPLDVCPKKAQRLRRASELCWLGDTALAVGSESQSQLAAYDAQQCALLWRADRAHPGTLAVLCAGPGGAPYALCSGGGEDGTVALWDTRLSGSAQPRCRMALAPYAPGGKPEVTALALSSCATLLAAGSTDNRVRVYDLRGGTGASALHVLSHGAPPRVHRGRGSTTAMSVGAVDPGDQGVNGLAWFHSSPCLATAGGTGSGLWDVRMGAPCVLWRPVACAASPHLRGVNCVAVHGSDAAIVTGGDDMRVALWAPEGQAAWLGGLSLERR